MLPDAPRTGLPLATALFTAGLAPPGVFQAGGTYWYPVTPLGKAAWEPWRCIADSWHLVLRYRLHLVLWPTHPRVVCGLAKTALCGMHEEATNDEDLVAAVGRLAVRVHHLILTQEAAPCPP